MTERQPNNALRRRRERSLSRRHPGEAMSRGELADLVNAHVWQRTGRIVRAERKYIAKLERGTIAWPQEVVREALCDILSGTCDELGLVPPGHRDAQPLPSFHPQLAWSHSAAVDGAVLMSEVDEMNRRQLFQTTVAGLTGLALDWLTAIPVADAGQREGSAFVTEADVERLDLQLGRLRRMDDQIGGGMVLGHAQGFLARVTRALSSGRYTDAVGRRLHALAGETMRFCGWLCWDTEDHDLALHYWTNALHCAHVADDELVGANVLSYMAGMAVDRGRTQEAMRLAAAARLRLTGSTTVSAIAHLQFAEAAAAAGSERDARRAVDAAVAAFGTAGDCSPSWAYWLDGPHVDEMIGRVLMYLGDHGGAIKRLGAFVGGTHGQDREQARGLAILARILARSGEPEEACRVAEGALALVDGDVASPRTRKGLTLVQSELERFPCAAVVDFGERLRGAS